MTPLKSNKELTFWNWQTEDLTAGNTHFALRELLPAGLKQQFQEKIMSKIQEVVLAVVR